MRARPPQRAALGPAVAAAALAAAVGATAWAGATPVATSTVAAPQAAPQAASNAASPKSVTVAGDAAGLAPGVGVPLDLRVTNPDPQPLLIDALTVTVTGTSLPRCPAAANYAVTQLAPSAYPLSVPARSTRSLSELGVPVAARPTVRMLALATSQDACRGARVSLSYTGSGRGGPR